MRLYQLLESDDYTFTGLYHSTEKSDKIFYLDGTRERTPKLTSNVIHRYINELTTSKFGVPVRNGLFSLPFQNISYGSNKYEIYTKPGSRFFSNPKVSDLTIDEDVDIFDIAYKFIDCFNGSAIENIAEQNISFMFRPDNQPITFDQVRSILYRIINRAESDDMKESLRIRIDDTIFCIMDVARRYVDGIIELFIGDKFPRREVMIYSLDKIKLVKVQR